MDRTAKGAGVLAIQSAASTLLSTFLFMFAARILTRQEMGVYGAVTIVLTITSIVGRFGLNTAALRFIARLYGKENSKGASFIAKRTLILSTLSAFILSGFCFAFSPLISQAILGNNQYTNLFQIVSLALFTSILSVMFSAFIQGLQRFSRLAIILLVSQAVKMITSMLLLAYAFRVEALFLGTIVFNLSLIVFTLPTTIRLLRRDNLTQPIKPVVTFALPMAGYELIGYIYNSIDQFIVLNQTGVEALGVYTVALKAASLTLTIMGGPILTTLTPGLSEVHGRTGVISLTNALKPTSRYVSLFFIPATYGLAALSPLAIQILAGQKYFEASFPVAIICLGIATYGFSTMITSALIAAGKTGRVMGIMLITSLVGLVLTTVLTRFFGIFGAASAKAIMYIILLTLSIKLASKIIPISLDKRAITGSLTASSIMAVIVYVLAAPTSFKLAFLPLYLLTGLIVYGLILSRMRILTLHDIQIISQIIPGGKQIYAILYKTINKSSSLSSVAKKLLNC